MPLTNNQPLVEEIDAALKKWYDDLVLLSASKRKYKGGSTIEQKNLSISIDNLLKVTIPADAGIVVGLTAKITGALSNYPKGVAEWNLLIRAYTGTTQFNLVGTFISKYKKWADTYLGKSTLIYFK